MGNSLKWFRKLLFLVLLGASLHFAAPPAKADVVCASYYFCDEILTGSFASCSDLYGYCVYGGRYLDPQYGVITGACISGCF